VALKVIEWCYSTLKRNWFIEKYLLKTEFSKAITMSKYIEQIVIPRILTDFKFNERQYVRKMDLLFLSLKQSALRREIESSLQTNTDVICTIQGTWMNHFTERTDWNLIPMLEKLSTAIQTYAQNLTQNNLIEIQVLWWLTRSQLLYSKEDMGWIENVIIPYSAKWRSK